MDFRQMRYLIAVAEYKSVSRAAEALYVSQSALSHYIKYAENDLGVALFDRSTTPLSLTYAGKCYIETAKRILLENEKLNKELRDITNHMTGKLCIGTSRDRASYMMPKLLPEFAKKYPGIKIEIFTESGQKLREKLREGRIDLLLLPDNGRKDEQGICSEIIYVEELVLAAKKGVIKSIEASELNKMPFLMQFQEHTTRSFCDSYFKRRKIKPEILMEFPSNITCYRMAAAGMGLAVIPFMITQLSNADGDVELHSLGSKGKPETWNVLVYWRKDAYLGQPELDLIRMAKEIFSREKLYFIS